LNALHAKGKAYFEARRPAPLICQQCGQSFQVRAYRVGEARYCSKACADAAKRLDNPEKACERCGTLFKKRFASETAKARFCSEACACRDMTENRERGYTNPEKPCERCGTMFRKRFASETAKARFCSALCAGRTITEQRMAVVAQP
jgi:hypothetical protein